jgi:2,3-bisphosphoglycerate-dependent phosphoglycerate mutase
MDGEMAVDFLLPIIQFIIEECLVMKTIYLVRHCSATGQSAEAELTDSGRQQAKDLVSFFENKSINHILSSPYLRAQQSILPTAISKKLEIYTDAQIAERLLSPTDLPDWMTHLENTFSDLDLKLPGGESSREATDRALKVIKEAPNHSILVTHGNLLSLILSHFDNSYGFKEWKTLSNPDVYMLNLDSSISTFLRIWDEKSDTSK